MADAYVDLEQTASTAVSPYDTWAKAAATFQAAIDQAGVGGRVFARIDGDGVGTTTDSAGSRTITFPGTDQVPFALYGVKDATTAAPPADSDLCVRGTDALPVIACTNDLILDDVSGTQTHTFVQGVRFDSVDQLRMQALTSWEFDDCEFDFDDLIVSSGTHVKFINPDFEFRVTGSNFQMSSGGFVEAIGGVFSGAIATIAFDDNGTGTVWEFYGTDLSLITGTLLDLTGSENLVLRLVNCKLGTGVTRTTGVTGITNSYIELIGSSTETGLGSGESVRDYAKEYYRGTILNEATFVRTGGANDGVAGFSYALTPRTASTKEGLLSLETRWFGGLVEGDASTSKDFTIYIANSSGSDKTKADVWVEILYPSEAGVTQHDFDISSRTAIDVSASDVTDDTASDWSTGAGGKNAQKIVIAKTPDFTGPVYARVHFAQAGTNTLYVDPKVYVTDT